MVRCLSFMDMLSGGGFVQCQYKHTLGYLVPRNTLSFSRLFNGHFSRATAGQAGFQSLASRDHMMAAFSRVGLLPALVTF